MRTLGTIVTIFLLSVVTHAQDRLVLLGFHGTDASGRRTAEMIEADASETAIGPANSVLSLPLHGTRSHQLVSMAGARYIAWLAQVAWGPEYSQCRDFVAVFDRRFGTARVVPSLELPCGIAKLVGDRRRPRLFLHTWTTVGGWPGTIASIDEHLTVRPIVISNRLGTALAYAPDADQLFVTQLGPVGDRTLRIAVFNASSGEEIRTFPARDALNVSTAQMQVTSDGRRLFLWTAWGRLLPLEQEIRAFDAMTGFETAASRSTYLGGGSGSDRFVLDEKRNTILTPHVNFDPPPTRYRLLAFDATTLAFEGEPNPGGYGPAVTFQPLSGRGTASGYLLVGAGESSGACRVWIDAFDGTGAIRTRADLPQLANSWCTASGIMLSAPDAPSHLSGIVNGRRVTLVWTNPGDTSEFELEAGLAPGRRDLALRVGLVTEFSADGVPPGVYYVRVRAVNEIGVSPVSNEVRVVVP